MMMNPQLQAKFFTIDRNHSGKISVNELTTAYSHYRIPLNSMQMLMRGITDLPFIDMNTFPMLDQYITSFSTAYTSVSMGRPMVLAAESVRAL